MIVVLLIKVYGCCVQVAASRDTVFDSVQLYMRRVTPSVAKGVTRLRLSHVAPRFIASCTTMWAKYSKGHIDAQNGESDHRTARSVLFKLEQGVFLCLCDLGVR